MRFYERLEVQREAKQNENDDSDAVCRNAQQRRHNSQRAEIQLAQD